MENVQSSSYFVLYFSFVLIILLQKYTFIGKTKMFIRKIRLKSKNQKTYADGWMDGWGTLDGCWGANAG